MASLNDDEILTTAGAEAKLRSSQDDDDADDQDVDADDADADADDADA
jgi:hypothetical protein